MLINDKQDYTGYMSFYVLCMCFLCGVVLVLPPVTEGSSDFSESDLDMRRRRSRRSQRQAVNYRETSDSDGSQAATNRDRTKPRRRLSSSDSKGLCIPGNLAQDPFSRKHWC